MTKVPMGLKVLEDFQDFQVTLVLMVSQEIPDRKENLVNPVTMVSLAKKVLLGIKGQRGLLETKETKEILVFPVTMGRTVLLENPVNLALRDLKAKKAMMDLLVLLDLKVTMALQDSLVLMEITVHLGSPVHPEVLDLKVLMEMLAFRAGMANLVNRVPLVLLVQLGKTALQVRKVVLENPENLVLKETKVVTVQRVSQASKATKVNLVPKVNLVLLVLRVTRVTMVKSVPQGNLALLDPTVITENLVTLAQTVSRATKVTKESLGFKVPKALRVRKVHLVLQGLVAPRVAKVNKVPLACQAMTERKVNLAPQGQTGQTVPPVLPVPKEILAQMVAPANPVPLDPKVIPVNLANLDLTADKDRKAPKVMKVVLAHKGKEVILVLMGLPAKLVLMAPQGPKEIAERKVILGYLVIKEATDLKDLKDLKDPEDRRVHLVNQVRKVREVFQATMVLKGIAE